MHRVAEIRAIGLQKKGARALCYTATHFVSRSGSGCPSRCCFPRGNFFAPCNAPYIVTNEQGAVRESKVRGRWCVASWQLRFVLGTRGRDLNFIADYRLRVQIKWNKVRSAFGYGRNADVLSRLRWTVGVGYIIKWGNFFIFGVFEPFYHMWYTRLIILWYFFTFYDDPGFRKTVYNCCPSCDRCKYQILRRPGSATTSFCRNVT